MKFKKTTLNALAVQLDEIIAALDDEAQKHASAIEKVDHVHRRSSLNLVHYDRLRSFDLRSLQRQLRNLSLSRFANADGHVMASLLNARFLVHKLLGSGPNGIPQPELSMKKARRLLTRNSKALLGYRSKGRRVRIMVTQPTESAYNYALVREMVTAGMNCARINCAHDSPEIWLKMITNIRRAAKKTGKRVMIAMDLAGPKIRTGQIKPGPKIRKFTPLKDVTGSIISPAEIIFVTALDEFSPPNALVISQPDFESLRVGDTFELIDTRHKKRVVKIFDRRQTEVYGYCYETSYIGTGTTLTCISRKRSKVVIGDIPPVEQALVLHVQDSLKIMRKEVEGSPAIFDGDGKVLQEAHISCQMPEIFKFVEVGERILFDDGKIEGVIEEVKKQQLVVRITRAKENGSKLKAEKGMNFPDTALAIPGLTSKDRLDLEFVARHADIVNFSFVHAPADVKELYTSLDALGVLGKIGVILKIETRGAFDQLFDILLSAMASNKVGVMIARGDLAVETGWDKIAKVQEEILKLCAAAHVPVVWATQVLENLSKKGLPSRAEITDAASAVKSECVMLNKGSHITRAISLLHTILSDMELMQENKEVMLPKKEKYWQ